MGFNGLSFKYVSSVMGWIMHIQRETTQFVQYLKNALIQNEAIMQMLIKLYSLIKRLCQTCQVSESSTDLD